MNKSIIWTVSVKLDVGDHDAVLQETQRRFNEAATWIASVAWDERITNNTTAHHRVYRDTRARYALGAQLAICARAKAMEAIASVKAKHRDTCPQFGPRGSIRYDAHTYRLMSLDSVSLNTLQGRVVCRLIVGGRQRMMLVDPAWEIGGADLIWRRGTYYLNVTQSREAPEQSDTNERLGVDLGIVRLATDSTGEVFTGAKVREVRARYHRRRQTLQKVGTRSAKRRLKQMSGRERRFQTNTNHRISTALVAKAKRERKVLALEDLTGIRERATVRRSQRYEHSSWAFYQLRTFLTYKAVWAGVSVQLVDPRNTSQTCSACGHCTQANRHSQASFCCQQCGYSTNADYNAAINISRAAVKPPMVATRKG